jgi:hypothetical protein
VGPRASLDVLEMKIFVPVLNLNLDRPAHSLVTIPTRPVFYNFFFLLAVPFWLRKITTDPQILAHENTECTDGRYLTFKILMTGLILYRYQYTPVAHVTMHRKV